MQGDMVLPLIPERSFGAAFAFGRRAIVRMLLEHWWYYALVMLAGSLWTASIGPAFWDVPSSVPTQYTWFIGMLPYFPALAAAARLANPSFRLTARSVFAVAVIYFATYASLAISNRFILPLLSTKPTMSIFALQALTVTGSLLYYWIETKVALAPAMYVLFESRGESIADAFRDSWGAVAGSRWWQLFWLSICIAVICLAGPLVLDPLIVHAWGRYNPFGVSFLAGLFNYAGSIVAAVWSQASLVAFATAPPTAASVTQSPSEVAAQQP
jgi:hypothetical protein